MVCRENLPMMLSANEIQLLGFTRTMAYAILNREDVPVVTIGKRKYVQREKFFDWLDSRENGEDTVYEIAAKARSQNNDIK